MLIHKCIFVCSFVKLCGKSTMGKLLRIIFIMSCLCTFYNTQAQQKMRISGVVKDVVDKTPLAFVNVYVKNKLIGVATDFEGKFSLEIPSDKSDTLMFTYVGYRDYILPIHKIFNRKRIKIDLSPLATELNEIVIKPTENPAHPILRNINSNKKANNPERNKNIEFDKYSKNLIILKDIEQSFTEKKIFKNYKQLFIKQNNNKYSIPIYFSEKLSSNIIQENPKFESTQILSENVKNISFVDIDEINGYKEELTNQTNIYNNQLSLFGRSFISPIASTGLLYYKYYLVDSTKTSNNTTYRIEYKPKNSKDLVFKGYFIVEKNNWSIQEISAEISENANINFLNSLSLSYSYKPIDSSSMYYNNKNIIAEFTYNKLKDTTQKQTKIIMQLSDSFNNISKIDKAIDVEEFTWEKHNKTKDYSKIEPVQIEGLSSLEHKSTIIIDSLNNSWFVKSTDKIYNTLLSGYIDVGKIGIGPYLEMIKRNKLEGTRFNLGIRTNESFNNNYMLYGSVGYGTKDKNLKYSGSVLYKLNTEKRRTITVSHTKDIVRLSENGSIFKIKENMLCSAKDNIITAFAKRNQNESLYKEISTKVSFSNEWNKNFSTNISFLNRTLSNTEFGILKKDNIYSDLVVNELKIDNRISFHEKTMDKYVRRYYLGTNYPIFHIGVDLGRYSFNNSSDYFMRFSGTIKHSLNLGLTKLKYVAEMGHMFGSVPFPLLEINRSNQTRGYARFSFNLMENNEFISSSFISIMPELHLNGLLFNKIPFIKNLNLREVISAKSTWGYLDKKHIPIMDITNNSSGLNSPYCEMGIGIENIFKYLRIDGVWRLTNNNAKTQKFGIFFSMYFSL